MSWLYQRWVAHFHAVAHGPQGRTSYQIFGFTNSVFSCLPWPVPSRVRLNVITLSLVRSKGGSFRPNPKRLRSFRAGVRADSQNCTTCTNPMQNQWFGARADSREPGADPAQKSGSRARRADAVPNRGRGSRLRRDEKLQGGDQSSFLFLHIRTCISRRAALASGRQTRQVGARAGRCHKRGACGRRGGAGVLSARGRAGRGWRGRGAGMTQERASSEAFDGHLV